MGSRPKFGLFAVAAVFICLAGSLRAAVSDVAFTVRTPVAHAPARIEFRPATPVSADWEIDVGFDPVRCEVYCSYRLKRDDAGRTPFLPPPAVLRIYPDGASQPATVAIDPAGVQQPALAATDVPAPIGIYLPGREVAPYPPDSGGARIAIGRPEPSAAEPIAAAVVTPARPLRI